VHNSSERVGLQFSVAVQSSVGLLVGGTEGRELGESVGRADGIGLGTGLGENEDNEVGLLVGNNMVGILVGLGDGSNEGL